jgi:hypothetical protein
MNLTETMWDYGRGPSGALLKAANSLTS